MVGQQQKVLVTSLKGQNFNNIIASYNKSSQTNIIIGGINKIHSLLSQTIRFYMHASDHCSNALCSN